MISFVQKHRLVFLASVFLVMVLLNAIGVGKLTSPTSKDEYHRVFRTALTMIEENVWFVPLLDGNPRIEEPPFLNWLTRLSFEGFGVSVGSARLIILLFFRTTCWDHSCYSFGTAARHSIRDLRRLNRFVYNRYGHTWQDTSA